MPKVCLRNVTQTTVGGRKKLFFFQKLVTETFAKIVDKIKEKQNNSLKTFHLLVREKIVERQLKN